MNGQYLILVISTITIVLIFIQRSEAGRRKMAIFLLFVILLLFRHNAFLKDFHGETALGIGIGFVVSFLFWLLIGRYNPVGSSDAIQVIGMDD